MAIAVKGAVNGLASGNPERIKRVFARFTKPVLPGEELNTRFWTMENSGGVITYGFTTHNPAEQPVIEGGIVEVAS